MNLYVVYFVFQSVIDRLCSNDITVAMVITAVLEPYLLPFIIASLVRDLGTTLVLINILLRHYYLGCVITYWMWGVWAVGYINKEQYETRKFLFALCGLVFGLMGVMAFGGLLTHDLDTMIICGFSALVFVVVWAI